MNTVLLMTPMHCRKDKGAFIKWHKIQEKTKRHEQMKYHHDAMIAIESLLNSVENPEQNVNNRIDDENQGLQQQITQMGK